MTNQIANTNEQYEPLYTITHPIMGEWDVPITASNATTYIKEEFCWHEGVSYSVEERGALYVYAERQTNDEGEYFGDFNPSSDNWVRVSPDTYRIEIGELYEDEAEEPTDPEPFGTETAVRLLEEGFITETEGIYINRASGHAGNYDISKDSDDHAMYSVVWSHGIVASTQVMNQAEVFLLLTDEARLGATFYWQTMPNNEWELTNAPVLPEPTAPVMPTVPTAREMAEQIRSEVEDGWTEIRHAWAVDDYLFVIWDHEGMYNTSVHGQIYKRTDTGWVEAEKETIL